MKNNKKFSLKRGFKNLVKKSIAMYIISLGLRVNVLNANAVGSNQRISKINNPQTKTQTKTEVLERSEKKNKEQNNKEQIKNNVKNNLTQEDLVKLINLAENKLLNRDIRRSLNKADKRELKPMLKSLSYSQFANAESIAFLKNVTQEKYISLIQLKDKIYSNIIELNKIAIMIGGQEKEKQREIRAIVTWLIILFKFITNMIKKIEEMFEILLHGLSNFINNVISFLKKKYKKLSFRGRIIFHGIVLIIITYYFYTINLLEKLLGIISQNPILAKIFNLENLTYLKATSRRKFKELLHRKIFDLSLESGIYPYNGGYFLNKNIFMDLTYIVNTNIFERDYVKNVIKGILYLFLRKKNLGLLLNPKINWKSWLKDINCSDRVKNFYNDAVKEARSIVYNGLPLEESKIWKHLFGYDCQWLKDIVTKQIISQIQSMSEEYKDKYIELLLVRKSLYDTLNDIGLKVPEVEPTTKLTDSLDLFLEALKYGPNEPLERLIEQENVEKPVSKDSLENKSNKNINDNDKSEIFKTEKIEIKSKDFDKTQKIQTEKIEIKPKSPNIKNHVVEAPKINEDPDYIDLDLIDKLNNNNKDSNN